MDELLIDAEMLAKFTNLKATEVEAFHQSICPDFLPNFWDLRSGALWQQFQSSLREVWDKHFPLAGSVELIVLVDRYSQVVRLLKEALEFDALPEVQRRQAQEDSRRRLEKAYHLMAGGFTQISQTTFTEALLQALPGGVLDPVEEVWPCQRAVMFLTVNPWRARFCATCGNRFIAVRPRSLYCSPTCFEESRRGAKRAWWKTHGRKLRRRKRR